MYTYINVNGNWVLKLILMFCQH